MNEIHVPVGHTCRAANQARFSKKRKTAYPFDWTLNNYEFVYKFLTLPSDDFLTNIQLGPKAYHQKYEVNEHLGTDSEVKLVGVYDVKYNVILVHDIKPAETNLANIKNKYLKRRERLISDIKVATHITLHTNEWSDKTLDRERKICLDRYGKDIKSIFTSNEYTFNSVKQAIKNLNSNAEINVKNWHE